MRVSKDDLTWATSEGLISPGQADALWQALERRKVLQPRFDVPNVAYYLGALIVISAMGWFMTLGWERFGGAGIFVISIVYGACFGLAGRALWTRDDGKTPGGLLFTMAVWMTPLAIYGLERLTGIWPRGDPGVYPGYHLWIKGSWFLMELGTIIVGAVALRFVPFPFLTFPIAFALWYMSMDLTPLLFGKTSWDGPQGLWVSLAFGVAVIIVAFFVDRRTKEDYAFWGYLFGLLAFWSGLSGLTGLGRGDVPMYVYALINVGLMILSILLQRRAFMVFGALGIFWYLSYLAGSVFRNSLLFPFALTVVGLAIMYAGIQYHRHQARIEEAIRSHIPEGIRQVLPDARARA